MTKENGYHRLELEYELRDDNLLQLQKENISNDMKKIVVVYKKNLLVVLEKSISLKVLE